MSSLSLVYRSPLYELKCFRKCLTFYRLFSHNICCFYKLMKPIFLSNFDMYFCLYSVNSLDRFHQCHSLKERGVTLYKGSSPTERGGYCYVRKYYGPLSIGRSIVSRLVVS